MEKAKSLTLRGFLVDPNTQLRIDAVQKAANETGGAVEVIQVIADIDAPEPAEEENQCLPRGTSGQG